MDIDASVAAGLGFPKLRYVFVEHERRWLCKSVPGDLVVGTEQITDLYVTGSHLRLREARSACGAPAMLRLTRKVDVDPCTRLISSVYLQEAEFVLRRAALNGRVISKRRLRLHSAEDVVLAVDEFEGELAGLRLLEAEFPSAAARGDFQAPWYAGTEVTNDKRFTGGSLAFGGLPGPTAPTRPADDV